MGCMGLSKYLQVWVRYFIEYSNVRHVVLSGVCISFTLSHRVHYMLIGCYARLLGCRNAGPPTPKRSFVVLKLPIFTEFDLIDPNFHFSLDLLGPFFSGQRHTPIGFRTEHRWLTLWSRPHHRPAVRPELAVSRPVLPRWNSNSVKLHMEENERLVISIHLLERDIDEKNKLIDKLNKIDSPQKLEIKKLTKAYDNLRHELLKYKENGTSVINSNVDTRLKCDCANQKACVSNDLADLKGHVASVAESLLAAVSENGDDTGFVTIKIADRNPLLCGPVPLSVLCRPLTVPHPYFRWGLIKP